MKSKMDVLKPELTWIEGRCYRLPTLDPHFAEGESSSDGFFDNNWNESDTKAGCPQEYLSDDDDDEHHVETSSNGSCKMSFSLARAYRPLIIGAKGATKKRIENETRTVIFIPRQSQSGDVVISGPTKRDVILARRNIDAIIVSSRQKMPFTHFISIPMTREHIKKRFVKFKEEVLHVCGSSRGIDETIFQHAEKLHLTLATLVLMDDCERKEAGAKLEQAVNEIVKPLLSGKKPCMIEMKGIEYMNDDPSEVDVLYGRVSIKDSSNCELLNQVANGIVRYFRDSNLLKIEDDIEVKLHVTLMNTIFRGDKPEETNEQTDMGGRYRRDRKIRESFDATRVLKEFQDFYFGEQELKIICLSLRYSTSATGYYQSSYSVNL